MHAGSLAEAVAAAAASRLQLTQMVLCLLRAGVRHAVPAPWQNDARAGSESIIIKAIWTEGGARDEESRNNRIWQYGEDAS